MFNNKIFNYNYIVYIYIGSYITNYQSFMYLNNITEKGIKHYISTD